MLKDTSKKEGLESIFKNSKYALLKPDDNLTEKQKIKLEEVKKVFLKQTEIHQQTEAFRTIFNEAKDWTDGVFKMLILLKEAQTIFWDSASESNVAEISSPLSSEREHSIWCLKFSIIGLFEPRCTSTIIRWFGEISNFFESRKTSGAVEGINKRLKLIKRSGYGFRNFPNFRLQCLICCHLTIS